MKTENKWTVKFGHKSKQELLRQLEISGIGLNAYAATLFQDDKFTISTTKQTVQLVEVSVYELGFQNGALYDEISEVALKSGLQLCPLEIAPHFRLQFLSQEHGPYLTVASEKTRNDEEYPNGFYLRNYDGRLWLRGYRATSDWVWEAEHKFAFIESIA